jgi:hypothetical protein
VYHDQPPVICRRTKSSLDSKIHDWVVYKLVGFLGWSRELIFTRLHRSRVKNVIWSCPPPPRTLIMDFTLTHTRFRRSNLDPIGQHTHTRSSDGPPEPDGVLKSVTRANIIHYRQVYLNRPDPTVFMPVEVNTPDHIYDDFSRLLFLHDHRETSALTYELPEESGHFRFLHTTCLGVLHHFWPPLSSFSLRVLPQWYMMGLETRKTVEKTQEE